jgi:hypothetical protein
VAGGRPEGEQQQVNSGGRDSGIRRAFKFEAFQGRRQSNRLTLQSFKVASPLRIG